MPKQIVIKSHWRKLVDSFREAQRASYLPEYHHHSDRAANNRYYR
jgi:hypothetical protein